MQLRSWSEIYKHYSLWLAIALIVLNAILTVTTGIPVEWVTTINTILGVAIVVAKKLKQSLDTVDAVIKEIEDIKKPE